MNLIYYRTLLAPVVLKSIFMGMNIIFMGSPEFALPSLEMLAQEHRITGVVTQPDRPSGRGKVLTSPPVKDFAVKSGIPLIQPEKINTEEVYNVFKEWGADLIVVAAYGQILRTRILDMPRYGCLNVHASLLPRWRGASPIQAAIFHGDAVTGTTIMKLDTGLDTGPIISQEVMEIHNDDTAASLENRLAILGANLLCTTLPGYINGRLSPRPQEEKGVTYASLLKKEDGLLDLTRTVYDLSRQIRAYYPWPGTFIDISGEKIKILKAHGVEDLSAPSGNFGIVDKFPAVRAKDGWLLLDEVQPPGKRIMSGREFLCGAKTWKHLCND